MRNPPKESALMISELVNLRLREDILEILYARAKDGHCSMDELVSRIVHIDCLDAEREWCKVSRQFQFRRQKELRRELEEIEGDELEARLLEKIEESKKQE